MENGRAGASSLPYTHVPAHGPRIDSPDISALETWPSALLRCVSIFAWNELAHCTWSWGERWVALPSWGAESRGSCSQEEAGLGGHLPCLNPTMGLHPISCHFGLRHLTGSCLELSPCSVSQRLQG